MIVISIYGGLVKKAAIARVMVSRKLGGVVEETLSSIKLITSFA
jgi:hypothetical protein